MPFNPDAKSPTYTAIDYEIEGLDLTADGFPGLSFSGTLWIEPDYTLNNEEWYIESASAFYADGKTSIVYNMRSEDTVNRSIFCAVRAAVLADDDLCSRISDAALEDAQ